MKNLKGQLLNRVNLRGKKSSNTGQILLLAHATDALIYASTQLCL